MVLPLVQRFGQAELLVCLCYVTALVYGSALDEFEVSFGTKKTLGLKLDEHLKVHGNVSQQLKCPSSSPDVQPCMLRVFVFQHIYT